MVLDIFFIEDFFIPRNVPKKFLQEVVQSYLWDRQTRLKDDCDDVNVAATFLLAITLVAMPVLCCGLSQQPVLYCA